MLLFKACPRCAGDMHISGDLYGDYKVCLQCGMMQEIEKKSDILASVQTPVKAKSRKKKVA